MTENRLEFLYKKKEKKHEIKTIRLWREKCQNLKTQKITPLIF